MAKSVSIRALFALAAVLDWEILQLDIKTAFLYPDLEEEIYMELRKDTTVEPWLSAEEINVWTEAGASSVVRCY